MTNWSSRWAQQLEAVRITGSATDILTSPRWAAMSTIPLA